MLWGMLQINRFNGLDGILTFRVFKVKYPPMDLCIILYYDLIESTLSHLI